MSETPRTEACDGRGWRRANPWLVGLSETENRSPFAHVLVSGYAVRTKPLAFP